MKSHPACGSDDVLSAMEHPAVNQNTDPDTSPDSDVDGIAASFGGSFPDLAKNVACPVALNLHLDVRADQTGDPFFERVSFPTGNIRGPDNILLREDYPWHTYSHRLDPFSPAGAAKSLDEV